MPDDTILLLDPPPPDLSRECTAVPHTSYTFDCGTVTFHVYTVNPVAADDSDDSDEGTRVNQE